MQAKLEAKYRQTFKWFLYLHIIRNIFKMRVTKQIIKGLRKSNGILTHLKKAE